VVGRTLLVVRQVDYKPKPIDDDFLNKPDEYPITGEHEGHKVRAEGKQRLDTEGKRYPTRLGIHGTEVAVDWETCVADGVCMDVCPVDVFQWHLKPGTKGTGNDLWPLSTELHEKYRTDKSDPIREKDCIFCRACEIQCPVQAIKITEP
jgi:NAD-dependent dihydropyrimidine dehydrogenase PreA subunit